MDSLEMEKALINSYNDIFKDKGNEPSWAVHKNDGSGELVHCTIPFVGRQYASQDTKMLVYASAENLTYYCKDPDEKELDDDEFAVNRHRKYFNDRERNANRLFPYVHLKPIENGCLITAAYYIYQTIVQDAELLSPAQFEERIAFANFAKYSIKGDINVDYPRDPKEFKKLRESHEYIKEDLKILKPEIIVMPKNIFEIDREFINEIILDLKLKIIIVPIYQITDGVLNRSISPKWERKPIDCLELAVQVWYDDLECNRVKEVSKHLQNKCLHLFSYLDYVLNNNIISIG